jgi:hypothetical protein
VPTQALDQLLTNDSYDSQPSPSTSSGQVLRD